MNTLTTIINWLKSRNQKNQIDKKLVAKANGIAAHVQNATLGSQLK